MKTIGFIGGGNMAEALLKGILEAELYTPHDIWISDVRKDRLDALQKEYGIRAETDNCRLAGGVNTLVLSIKPQQMADVLKEIAGCVKSETLVISIAAGITTGTIRGKLGEVQIVRVMPNTPALVGVGASGLFSAGASEESLQTALEIFSSVGKAIVVEDENLIDAITAVSGSGPAYFFLLMEAMVQAGADLGLSEESAGTLVLQTAKGAALLAEAAQKRGETPAILRKKVTSPGGTTEAALKVFAAAGFEPMVRKALKAAFDRGQELSKTR